MCLYRTNLLISRSKHMLMHDKAYQKAWTTVQTLQ